MFFAILLALVPHTQAQIACSLSVDASVLPAKAGGNFVADLTVTITPGWHIASITQPDGGPVRTEITLAENLPFRLAGSITGPKPHVEHSAAFDMNVETYTGTVVFTLPLVATEDIKPGTKLTVGITYQACNDETCLLPKTEKVSCIIGEPKPPAEKPKAQSPEKQ